MKAHRQNDHAARFGEPEFKRRGDSFDHCSYCGSLSVADAIKALETPGTRFSGSDWKYGYPHKFYLDIDSGKPAAPYYTLNGERVSKEEYDRAMSDPAYGANEHGGRSLGTGHEPGTGTVHAKFYTEHLLDATPEELARFNELSRRFFRIEFVVEGERFGWRAPHHGFQNWGTVPAEPAATTDGA